MNQNGEVNLDNVFAFSYVSELRDLKRSDGWNHVDLAKDYSRLGLPNAKWVQTNLNTDFSLCDTYPSRLFVPASASKPVLIGSSKFRSRNRLPVLAYLYPQNQACICRCAQPLSGFSARNVEDEELFQHVLKTNTDVCNMLYVIDTRPKINAMANKAAGKGFENETFYSNIKFHFCGIENIHIMRSSQQKLIDVCSQSGNMSTFLTGLDSSGWLKHTRAILEAAAFVAQSVHRGITCVVHCSDGRDRTALTVSLSSLLLDPFYRSVHGMQSVHRGISCVVHCSDGWDRTALTVSLSSLLLDPFYRSVHGMQILIERDWLSFGHKFSDRCGHVFAQTDIGTKEVAPIFTQFLDAVWQLTEQFPTDFQFNERFLLVLQEHAHSCQFGTFLGNCEKDRIDLRLSQRTYSLWGFMSLHFEEYVNVFYDPARSAGLLKPDLKPQAIKLWTALFNRFETGVHPREPAAAFMEMAREQTSLLSDHIDYLQARLANLRAALGKPPVPAMTDSGINASSHSTAFTQNHVKQSDSESGFEEPCSPVGPGGKTIPGLTSQMSVTSLDLSEAWETSITLHWTPIRSIVKCHAPECTADLDLMKKKRYCWRCGKSFCSWCVSQRTILPCLASQVKVPVCKSCFAVVNETSPE